MVERADGEVRCRPAFLRELWSAAPRWRAAVAPIAEDCASRLAATSGQTAATPLTGRSRTAAVEARLGRATWAARSRELGAGAQTCTDCGGPVQPGRKRCPACHTAWQRADLCRIGQEGGMKRWARERTDGPRMTTPA